MTRAEILASIKGMIGPGNEVSDTILNVWINDVYLSMCDQISQANPDYFYKSSTADTVASQQEYELPSDFEKALLVNINYGGGFTQALPLGKINSLSVPSTTSYNVGSPRYYIIGNVIGFNPVPTEAGDERIKVWYTYSPAELSTDASEPVIPRRYQGIIKQGVYAMYLDQNDEHTAAEIKQRRFDQMVEDMADSLSQLQVDEPMSVTITTNQDAYYEDNGSV